MMLNSRTFLAVLVTALFATACYPIDIIDNKLDDGTAEQRFLKDGAPPEVVIFNAYQQQPMLTEVALEKAGRYIVGDETDIFVRLQNSAGVQVDSWIEQHPGRESPSLSEAFYSQVCDKDVLVLVIEKPINTAVSFGESYFNALFDPVSGEWLTTLSGAKVEDIHTGELFENQKALLATLKMGTDTHCPELFNPAKRRQAAQWLRGSP